MRSQNAAVAVTALVLGLLLFASWNQEHLRVAQGLVVYCAHDLEYAEPILMEFEKQTGIAIVLVGDTEANKSLGLVERLLREKAQPRGDLFWNNQALGTERLQQAGVLQPYRGSGYARIPSKYKAEDGSWTGFAGRLRVWIINTKKLEATDQAVTTALAAPDLSRFALAKPLFGTTLSHYSLLWQRRGGEM